MPEDINSQNKPEAEQEEQKVEGAVAEIIDKIVDDVAPASSFPSVVEEEQQEEEEAAAPTVAEEIVPKKDVVVEEEQAIEHQVAEEVAVETKQENTTAQQEDDLGRLVPRSKGKLRRRVSMGGGTDEQQQATHVQFVKSGKQINRPEIKMKRAC